MATAEQRNHAKALLRKAQEYLASAEDNFAAERYTPSAGDAIHAGISAKDAIVTVLTGASHKDKDHATSAKELKQALGQRAEAATAEKALRDLLSAKTDVEYGVGSSRSHLLSSAWAPDPVRRNEAGVRSSNVRGATSPAV